VNETKIEWSSEADNHHAPRPQNLKSVFTSIQILIDYSTLAQTSVSLLQGFCDHHPLIPGMKLSVRHPTRNEGKKAINIKDTKKKHIFADFVDS